jgi:pyrimidine deaminase RibD-like protein
MSANSADRDWLRQAIDVSRACPISTSAYAVGAIIVDRDGRELARGYSRQSDPHEHAEEAALAKLPPGVDLAGATIYSSLEPCSTRKSRPRTCTELILAAAISRVVCAMREPPIFVDCQGAEILSRAGVDVLQINDLEEQVRQVNAHLFNHPAKSSD